jgi:Family of unknown function (DUF5684)
MQWVYGGKLMNRKQPHVRRLGVLLAVLFVLGSSSFAVAQDHQARAAAAAGVAMFTFFIVFAVMYIFFALAIQTIAQKTGTPNPWLAWIPIVNIILLLTIAKKPLWWILLLLIPVVNIVVSVIVWMAVAEVREKPSWWGILTIIPIANLIAVGYLAWAD